MRGSKDQKENDESNSSEMVQVKLHCVEELKVRQSTSLISLDFPSKREETRLIVRMKNYKPCTVLVLSLIHI